MWESFNYNLIGDLDICMNPYGKDTYGNYRIGIDSNTGNIMHLQSKSQYRVVSPLPAFKVGDYCLWEINGNIYTGVINSVYPASQNPENKTRYGIYLMDENGVPNCPDEVFVYENACIELLDPEVFENTNKDKSEGDYVDDNNIDEFVCDLDTINTTSDVLNMDFSDHKNDKSDIVYDILKTNADIIESLSTNIDKLTNKITSVECQTNVNSDKITVIESDVDKIRIERDGNVNIVGNIIGHPDICKQSDMVGYVDYNIESVKNEVKNTKKLSKLALIGNISKLLL